MKEKKDKRGSHTTDRWYDECARVHNEMAMLFTIVKLMLASV